MDQNNQNKFHYQNWTNTDFSDSRECKVDRFWGVIRLDLKFFKFYTLKVVQIWIFLKTGSIWVSVLPSFLGGGIGNDLPTLWGNWGKIPLEAQSPEGGTVYHCNHDHFVITGYPVMKSEIIAAFGLCNSTI